MNKVNHILRAGSTFVFLLSQVATVFTALLFLSSCEHKDLQYDYSRTAELQVVFNWNKAPEAAPETMRLYLFPLDGGSPHTYEFTDYRGGRITVPAGRYKVLCVNSDTESVLYRNIDSFDSFEAYAPDGVLSVGTFLAPRPEGTSEERVAKSPDRLYSARLDDLTVELSKENQTVILYPELSVCRYRVEIRNVSNLQYVSSDGIAGSLSGMSGGLLVGRNELTSEVVTVPFGVVSDGVSTLKADFLAFGQTGSAGPAHKLVIYVIMADGSKNYYTFDVTTQVDEAANPYDVHILLDGLSLPKPIVNGGGFRPEVDEWQNINIDVPM